MREASFILPLTDGPSWAHTTAEDTLMHHFGGFSAGQVSGAWRDGPGGEVVRDTSIEYRVAAEWTNEKRNTFIGAALAAGREAGQDAVYVKMDTGRVLILSTDEGAWVPDFGGGLLIGAIAFAMVIAMMIAVGLAQ